MLSAELIKLIFYYFYYYYFIKTKIKFAEILFVITLKTMEYKSLTLCSLFIVTLLCCAQTGHEQYAVIGDFSPGIC